MTGNNKVTFGKLANDAIKLEKMLGLEQGKALAGGLERGRHVAGIVPLTTGEIGNLRAVLLRLAKAMGEAERHLVTMGGELHTKNHALGALKGALEHENTLLDEVLAELQRPDPDLKAVERYVQELVMGRNLGETH